MKYPRWQLLFALSLIITSFLIYLFHYLIFKDLHHIIVFLVEDIAFLPIEVLLVTLIIHRVLSNLEKSSRLEKLNMVIGAFFVQVGTKLLANLSDMAHLAVDIGRTYRLLVLEWLDYMGYLKRSYPYLFHLAMWTNPFDQKASPVIRGEES